MERVLIAEYGKAFSAPYYEDMLVDARDERYEGYASVPFVVGSTVTSEYPITGGITWRRSTSDVFELHELRSDGRILVPEPFEVPLQVGVREDTIFEQHLPYVPQVELHGIPENTADRYGCSVQLGEYRFLGSPSTEDGDIKGTLRMVFEEFVPAATPDVRAAVLMLRPDKAISGVLFEITRNGGTGE